MLSEFQSVSWLQIFLELRSASRQDFCFFSNLAPVHWICCMWKAFRLTLGVVKFLCSMWPFFWCPYSNLILSSPMWLLGNISGIHSMINGVGSFWSPVVIPGQVRHQLQITCSSLAHFLLCDLYNMLTYYLHHKVDSQS